MIYIQNSTFTDNYASQGAALTITRNSEIKVFNSTFVGNIAENIGVLDIGQDCRSYISSSQFFANKAEKGTSTVRFNKANANSNSVVNSRFQANVSK